MSDLNDLPLFANKPATRPPADTGHAHQDIAISAGAGISVRPTAQVIPFPLCCQIRLVEELASAFIRLRERHGRRCRTMLIAQRFRPLQARLRRLKVPVEVIHQEMACLEKAVAGVVWEADGRPSLDSDGGSAA